MTMRRWPHLYHDLFNGLRDHVAEARHQVQPAVWDESTPAPDDHFTAFCFRLEQIIGAAQEGYDDENNTICPRFHRERLFGSDKEDA